MSNSYFFKFFIYIYIYKLPVCRFSSEYTSVSVSMSSISSFRSLPFAIRRDIITSWSIFSSEVLCAFHHLLSCAYPRKSLPALCYRAYRTCVSSRCYWIGIFWANSFCCGPYLCSRSIIGSGQRQVHLLIFYTYYYTYLTTVNHVTLNCSFLSLTFSFNHVPASLSDSCYL